MKIFNYIKDTVYNPVFYSAQKEGSNKKAIYHLLSLILAQAILLTVIFTLYLIPVINGFTLRANIDKLTGYFPEELILTFKNGQLSTNVEEPYTITYTDPKNNTTRNAVYIDTVSPFTMELFEQSNSPIYLSKNYIVVKGDNGKIELQKNSQVPDIELSKSNIVRWTNELEPLFKYIIPITSLLILIMLLVATSVSSLILITIASFIIWCVLKIKKTPLHFGKIFRQVIYCLTTAVLMNIILAALGISSMGIVSLIIILIVYFANTKVVTQDQPLQ